jgi:hypothetical protein
MKFSLLPCYLVPLRPKYSPQHPILKHPQPTFVPQCQRPSFAPIQNNRQICNEISCLFCSWNNEKCGSSVALYLLCCFLCCNIWAAEGGQWQILFIAAPLVLN